MTSADQTCHRFAQPTAALAREAAARISSPVLAYEPRRCDVCGRWPLRLAPVRKST